MAMPLKALFLTVLLSSWCCLAAQEVLTGYPVEISAETWMLDVNNGLSQGMIYDLAIDKRGYLWVATKEGLNRYDGSGVKVFRHDPNDTLSISGNLVTCILVDNQNDLWVGTQTRGLNLFHRETESFIRFCIDSTGDKKLPSNSISKLFLTADGTVGVSFGDIEDVRLITSDQEKHGKGIVIKEFCEQYPVLQKNGHCRNGNPNTIEDNYKRNFRFSKDGSFWVCLRGDSIVWYSPKALKGQAEAKIFENANYPLANGEDAQNALIFNQLNDEVYLSDGRQTIKRFNFDRGSFEPFFELPKNLSLGRHYFVSSDGTFWSYSRDKERILRVNPQSGSIEQVEIGIPLHTINPSHPLIEDQFRNVWLPTNGHGVGKISALQNVFKRLPHSDVTYQNYWVWRIEKPGEKAFCDPKLTRDYLHFLSTTFPEELRKVIAGPYGLPTHLNVDRNNKLVFSSSAEQYNNMQCLISVDIQSGEGQDLYCKQKIENDTHGFIPVFFDRDGGIWICQAFNNQAVYIYHLFDEDSVPKSYRFPVNPGPLGYRFISDWYEDERGIWWFATVKGVFSLNPKTEEWKHFRNIEGDSSSLSFDITLSVCPDPRNPKRYLWIGTEGGGLNRLDLENENFVHFTSSDGLPNNVVYGVQSDDRGNLWMSTNKGLCLFDPSSRSVRNFTKADGLNGNEFNRYEYSKTTDGTLYFGGVEGITYFHPDEVYRDSMASRVVINGLKVLNKPVEYRNASASVDQQLVLPAPMEYTEHLEFDYDVGMISLSFTMLDLTVPEQHRFRYRLVGLDKVWIDAGKSQEAVYTNLSPGKYTFEVTGLNSFNKWSEPTKLMITIHPPWWATWWFRVIAVIAGSALIYYVYRERLKQALRVERMRNRIAQDLHDEIGSTLSSISLFSEVLKNADRNLSEKSQNLLEKISESSSEMMESMNDIVWTIKADNDRFEEVLNRMRAFAVSTTECRGIELEFTVHKEAEDLNLNMELRKNLYLIYKESLNNAIKYAKASKMRIAVSVHREQLKMIIQDDGIGFDPQLDFQDRSRMGGNGVRGMHARAEKIGATLTIESFPSKGTTVSLSVDMNKALKPLSKVI